MKTEVITLPAEGYDPSLLDKPAAALRAGELVAFPTETVYGIGANPELPGAVARLLEMRGSPGNKPLTLHIADAFAVTKWAPGPLPGFARRLMKRFWPGPLTLVFPTPDGKGIGIRYPAHKIATDLLTRVGAPVVAPSANRSGEPPATGAQEVLRAFDGRIEWIIDGGACRYAKASTVVRFERVAGKTAATHPPTVPGRAGAGRSTERRAGLPATLPASPSMIPGTLWSWEMPREGAIPRSLISELAYASVLFVCTGNTCRSPMAAAMFRRMIARGRGWGEDDLESHGIRIFSAGTAALAGGPANPQAVDAVRDQGVRLEGHSAQPVTVSMVEEADAVFVMTHAHLQTLREWVPDSADKIRLLDPDGMDIEDPIGGTPAEYRACASRLNRCLAATAREFA